MKVGFGLDVHAFAGPGPVLLGGVRVPHERGLAGHSDADVVAHAICDAIFGSVALGDIGEHFPSSDERWRDAPGVELIRHAVAMLLPFGLRISSVDVTVVCQQPAIGPHRDAMKRALADPLGVTIDEVSIKATTTDALGALGRGEGIAAHALAVLADAR